MFNEIELKKLVGVIDFTWTTLRIYLDMEEYMHNGLNYEINDLVMFKRFLEDHDEDECPLFINYMGVAEDEVNTLDIVVKRYDF